ncbi:hypothetical protein D0N37_18670 [Pseudoalteromonas piscicida]|nr:enoyl-CoA hydratase-related protein [Pseudoalteromonas piscicida]AXQ99541.1 hypothetical protein D0N37_18670 [Pseudoalteromonas piscicida]
MTSSEFTYISMTECDTVAHIVISNEKEHNAFGGLLIAELTCALEALSDSKHCETIVFSTTGRCFSTGASLEWMKEASTLDNEGNQKSTRDLANLLRLIQKIPQTTIAKVQGAAFGGLSVFCVVWILSLLVSAQTFVSGRLNQGLCLLLLHHMSLTV